VKEVLPQFDGALLDNIVDYFTYVIVPASFLYETRSVPIGFNLVSAILITLASAYQFCQSDAKTDDYCFKGFPSYWNVVAFYLFMLDWPQWVNLVIIVALTVAVFVPFKYLYPSRTLIARPLNVALTAVWAPGADLRVVGVRGVLRGGECLHYVAMTERQGGARV
jgi:phosphatidylcholine synthase